MKAELCHEELILLPIQEAKVSFAPFFEGRDISEGIFGYLPKKAVVKNPYLITSPGRLECFLGAYSELTLMIEPEMEGELECRFILEEGAKLRRFYRLDQKDHFRLVTHVSMKRYATFEATSLVTCLSSHGEEVVSVDILGEGANADLAGGWDLEGRANYSTEIVVHHQAPRSRSNQLYKGVVKDHAKSTFKGTIVVDQVAQKTESYQKNQNLVLGRAQAITHPGIRVFADDVKASHGATIAKPSEEEIFYFKTRGFSQIEAEKLIQKGFLNPICSRFNL